MNYVLFLFFKREEATMLKAMVHEAAALTSLALFVGMVAVWANVLCMV